MPERAQINVRTRDGPRPNTLQQLAALPGVTSVCQTFPDERDRDLARLFVVEADPSDAQAVVERLRSMSWIESADTAPPRAPR
jgi:hypothetical protein